MSIAASGPDQAIGWLIALACFFINVIMAGLARSASVLYVALIELYGVSREAASSPFTIRDCVRNLSGPFIGFLGQRYGIRNITVVGGGVAAFGIVVCYFAPDITWITALWGIIHGIGCGLTTVLHMMAVGQYFDKYKASALGLGYSGDCFGNFAFPLITDHLLQTYGISSTFLILGAIALNIVPMGMILRKPPWLKNKKNSGNFSRNIVNAAEKDLDLNKTNYEKELNGLGKENKAFISSSNDLTKPDSQLKQTDDVTVSLECSAMDQNNTKNNSYALKTTEFCDSSLKNKSDSFKTNIYDTLCVPRENFERHDSLPPSFEKQLLSPNIDGKKQFETYNYSLENTECKEDVSGIESPQCSVEIKNDGTTVVNQMKEHLTVHRMRAISWSTPVVKNCNRVAIQQDKIAYTEEIISNKDALNQIKPIPMENLIVHNLNNTNVPQLISCTNGKKETKNLYNHINKINKEKPPSSFQQFLRTNLKPIFVLISVSMAVYLFLFVGVLIIIIDYAADNGISHDNGNYLIVAYSIADLIGRLSFGQIIDRKLMSLKNYAGLTMVIMGVSMGTFPFNRSFPFMLVCISIYGLVRGGTAIMFPILINLYMEEKEESIAMGCINFYGGLLILLVAPMIGYFRDQTGSYDCMFYIMGCVVALVGLLWQLEPIIVKKQRKI